MPTNSVAANEGDIKFTGQPSEGSPKVAPLQVLSNHKGNNKQGGKEAMTTVRQMGKFMNANGKGGLETAIQNLSAF